MSWEFSTHEVVNEEVTIRYEVHGEGVTALGIFTLVNTWNSYFWPSIALIFNPELQPLSVAMLQLKSQLNHDPFNIAAGAMIMMIPVMIIFAFAQRFFMRGLEGAVK